MSFDQILSSSAMEDTSTPRSSGFFSRSSSYPGNDLTSDSTFRRVRRISPVTNAESCDVDNFDLSEILNLVGTPPLRDSDINTDKLDNEDFHARILVLENENQQLKEELKNRPTREEVAKLYQQQKDKEPPDQTVNELHQEIRDLQEQLKSRPTKEEIWQLLNESQQSTVQNATGQSKTTAEVRVKRMERVVAQKFYENEIDKRTMKDNQRGLTLLVNKHKVECDRSHEIFKQNALWEMREMQESIDNIRHAQDPEWNPANTIDESDED